MCMTDEEKDEDHHHHHEDDSYFMIFHWKESGMFVTFVLDLELQILKDLET